MDIKYTHIISDNTDRDWCEHKLDGTELEPLGSIERLSHNKVCTPQKKRALSPYEETLAAIEEGRRLLNDPNAPTYTSMNDLKKALGL